MKKRLVFISCILILFGITVSAQYKVMLSKNYPPYNFINEQGELVGFNIDILNAIKEVYNIDIEVSSGDWQIVNEMLEQNQIDGIAGAHYPGIPDENHHYTRSIINTYHCFFYNSKHSRTFSLEKLRTSTNPLVVAWNNDVLTHYVLSINPNAQFIYVDNYQDLVNALDREDVSCALSQKVAGMFYVRKMDKGYIYTSSNKILERNMGFKLSKESGQLAKILSNGLEVIISNGEFQRIYDLWIKEYNRELNDWQRFYRYLFISVIILAIIIFLLLFTNQILKKRVRSKTKDLERQLELNSQVMIELENQKEKAEESEKIKSAFLANMSHEIRTPMNSILGFADLLKDPEFSKKEQDKFIDLIQKGGDRMLATINNIIDISKIEAGVEIVKIEEVDISEIMTELNSFFAPEALKKGIELLFKVDALNQNSIFHTDIYKLNAVLTNLIKNALKFTEKGSVTVSYSIMDDCAKISVKDSGVGISKSEQKLIFNQFVQADYSLSSNYEGSGLGLSISKGYVDMLGGKIWVESAPGLGSSFYISIPNHQDQKILEQDDNDLRNETPDLPKDMKIIIAEDDESSLEVLSYSLKGLSDNVLYSYNGLEAIQLLKDNPDTTLILMDVKMPELNGLEATKRIREFNSDVFIIAQTAYAHQGCREEALDAGCNDYITKPIKKEKLIELIKKLVG